MQTTPTFAVHNSTISTSPVTLGKSPIGVHFSSTVSYGETQPEVVPIVSPVIMGKKGLNPRRTLNEIPATPPPTPPVSSAHSTKPMKGNIISSPYPLPSQTVQNTPSHFPSSPLPLTPPNYSPLCSTFRTGASLSTSAVSDARTFGFPCLKSLYSRRQYTIEAFRTKSEKQEHLNIFPKTSTNHAKRSPPSLGLTLREIFVTSSRISATRSLLFGRL